MERSWMALLCTKEGRSISQVKEAGDMKLQYLLVAGENQLELVHREHVEAIWRGRVHVAEFGWGIRLPTAQLKGRSNSGVRLELSVEETAAVLGKGYEAVKALQRRGLAALRRAICSGQGVPR